jgi:hypothetical protein
MRKYGLGDCIHLNKKYTEGESLNMRGLSAYSCRISRILFQAVTGCTIWELSQEMARN